MTITTIRKAPQQMTTRLSGIMPEASAATPRTATNTPIVISPLRIPGLENHGRAIGHDLAHGLADLGGIEAHHDDAVGAHSGRVLHEAVDGLAAGLFQELRIFVDLAAHDGAQARHDVAGDPARADDDAKDLAQRLFGVIAGDAFCGGDDHGVPLALSRSILPRIRAFRRPELNVDSRG